MSINIASKIVHFTGHTAHAIQRPPPSRSARCSLLSVRACAPCLALPYLVFARPGSGTACPAACAVQSVRVRWGLGSPPAGYIAAAQPRPVSPVTTEKIKKASKNPQLDFQPPKIFSKNKKTPTKGLCSVLYLPYKP